VDSCREGKRYGGDLPSILKRDHRPLVPEKKINASARQGDERGGRDEGWCDKVARKPRKKHPQLLRVPPGRRIGSGYRLRHKFCGQKEGGREGKNGFLMRLRGGNKTAEPGTKKSETIKTGDLESTQ